MTKTQTTSRRLVIDASVASQAGNRSAPRQVEAACSDFMMTVREVCHRTVFNPKLEEEWLGSGTAPGHATQWSIDWLTSMRSKGKVGRSGPLRTDLRSRLIGSSSRPEQVKQMQDDFHLIEAAFGADCRVASRDEKVRSAFKNAANHLTELQQILWVNPTVAAEEPIQWLQRGAPDEAARRLTP